MAKGKISIKKFAYQPVWWHESMKGWYDS